jgi:alkylation response protein AidB-like acyl-CoA dehydrogenase
VTDVANEDVRSIVRDGFLRYGRDSYPFRQRGPALASWRGYREDAWNDYAELGWLALRLPEPLGGLDADPAIIGSMMEMVGRYLLLEPLFASAVVGTGALVRGAPELLREMAPLLAGGRLILTMACEGHTEVRAGLLSGEKVGVLHGNAAHQFIVTTGAGNPAIYLVAASASGVTRRAYRLVDGRAAAVVTFNKVPAKRLGDAEALQLLLDESVVALCAEALGSTSYLVECTTAHLNSRTQFGRSLGSFQALQHRMSEMAILSEEISALTAAAQSALKEDVSVRARTIGGAAAYIVEAARTIGNEAIQLHGGIGITEALDVSHHFRRLMVTSALIGGRDAQFERFAASLHARRSTEEGA